MDPFHKDLAKFTKFITVYLKNKVIFLATHIEKFKNHLVEILLARRLIYQKRAWHASMVGLSAFGIVTAGVFGGETIVSTSFPGMGGADPRFAQAFTPDSDDPVLNSLYDTHTNISQKPRSEIVEYEVKSGDTLSNIGDKFNISVETIKWENKLESLNSIKPGQVLRILPVSGVAHKVKSGDTLESVAKLYSAESQAILDFPFNDIGDDFKLRIGQILIVPDGVPPTVAAPKPKQPTFVAQGPGTTFKAPGGGNFTWPTQGGMTQYFAWYHPGIDIANKSAPAVIASDGGVVKVAGWPDNYGYGNRIVIEHDSGYQTLYAHLSNIYVSVGQTVSRGQLIGQMGSPGRSTGTHLHFEMRYKGIAVNPLVILK
ncbi:MAG: peptidoglycan DD-metalloendopeptidase family protein [Candidatus Daviesbacteria bacterium]|nr:peptidoglycan DD-metalloendopeptidase family protein [Candidatus Daviesbacteria bacterium]